MFLIKMSLEVLTVTVLACELDDGNCHFENEVMLGLEIVAQDVIPSPLSSSSLATSSVVLAITFTLGFE